MEDFGNPRRKAGVLFLSSMAVLDVTRITGALVGKSVGELSMTDMKLKHPIGLPVSLALFASILFSGCANSSKSVLLYSNQNVTPPVGPVHLPAVHDGLSFQGNISVQGNYFQDRDLATPKLDEKLVIENNYDTSAIAGPIRMKQDQIVVSGEGSVFMSRNFRLFLGLDANSTYAMWYGMGFSAGETWRFEVDGSMGSLVSKRSEKWRLETEKYCYSSNDGTTCAGNRVVVDTLINGRDTADFWKLNFTFTRKKGGALIAYQLMNFPTIHSPNGKDFSLNLHTFTLGYHKPTPVGTFGAFVQATNLGKSWSPSARVQYSFNLGGEDEEDEGEE